MTTMSRALRPAFGALAAATAAHPLSSGHHRDERRTEQQRTARCDEWNKGALLGVGIGCAAGVGVSIFIKTQLQQKQEHAAVWAQFAEVTPEERRNLLEVVAKRGGSGEEIAGIEEGLEKMWAQLLNWCNSRLMDSKVADETSTEHRWKINMSELRALVKPEDSSAELAWLGPLQKWISDPSMLKRLDFDRDDMLDFKEFALLYLLTLMTRDKRSGGISRKSFLKVLHKLMDVTNDGQISCQEFVYSCSLLATFGLINAEKLEEFSKRPVKKEQKISAAQIKKGGKHPVTTVGGARIRMPLQKLFTEVFARYDYDGDGNLDLDEWMIFAGEWLDWSFLDLMGSE